MSIVCDLPGLSILDSQHELRPRRLVPGHIPHARRLGTDAPVPWPAISEGPECRLSRNLCLRVPPHFHPPIPFSTPTTDRCPQQPCRGMAYASDSGAGAQSPAPRANAVVSEVARRPHGNIRALGGCACTWAHVTQNAYLTKRGDCGF